MSILFLTFDNVNMLFVEQEPTWRLYTPAKALPITKQMQIISQKAFTILNLNPGKEVFVIHIACLSISLKISIHPTQKN